MPKKLFGTSGIRGPAETLFTDDFCVRIGYVFGQWLKKLRKEGFVALAMDPRESSPRIKDHIASGLAICGFEILDEGVIPTPALEYFLKESSHIAGAIMVTGSHITANLNGVKLMVDGEEVNKTQEVEIEELFEKYQDTQLVKVTPITKFESAALDLYVDMLVQLVTGVLPKWKILVDTTNGTQTEVVRRLFPRLKLKYLPVGEFDVQSPHFVPCDTEVPEMFGDLVREVLTQKADMGIAFDVDGDRVVFVDEKGRFIPGDYSCTLIAQASMSKSIVTPISTSSVIDHIGKKIYRTPVGSTWVAAKMKEVGSTFGFEANGGGLSSEISFARDGATTALKLLSILRDSGQKLSTLYDSLPRYYLSRHKVDCPFTQYSAVLSAVRTRYSSHPIDATDGLHVDLGNEDTLLFRGSGNSPEFKVFAQSKTLKRAESLAQEGLALVRGVITPHQFQTNTGKGSDTFSILESIKAFPQQCQQVLQEMPLQSIPSACHIVDNIVISGMGGSALGGRILTNLERQVLRVPVVVSTEYHLPNFVNAKSLVVISSYSGNTEETITSLDEALARQAQVFIITSGGKLAEIAKSRHLPHYVFDPKYNKSGQPRIGLGYNIMSILALLMQCQLVHRASELADLPKFLIASQPSAWLLAKQLAREIHGKIPVIIASEHLKGAAHDFKNQLNENAKQFAAFFDLPEANHHLLEGLGFPKTNPDNLIGVFLESSKYHPEVRKRYPITQDVFYKQHIAHVSIQARGETQLAEVLYMVQLVSLAGFELSQLNGIDPGPIPWVDYFKDQVV